jgi:short-subunit dehydrogenase
MKHDLSECVIWVTGASSGIGASLAKELSKNKGLRLIISARGEHNLQSVAAECENPPIVMPLDVTDKEATVLLAQKIKEQFGRLDIVILNAGDCLYLDIESLDEPIDVAIFEKMMNTNFLSTVYGVSATLPLLNNSSQPHLVIMSSSVVYLPLPRAEAYGASKAAVEYFGNTLRIQLAPYKIPVSVIYPGFVKTPLTQKNNFPMPFLISSEESAKRIIRGITNYQAEITFPWPLILLLKTLNLLPIAWQVALLKKTIPKRTSKKS